MQDRKFLAWTAAIFLLIALLPQLYGLLIQGDRMYTGFDVNPDDMCVYGAWMEQARRGHFFFYNPFTTDEQPRMTVHLFFYALGTAERFTGLSFPVVFHAARLLFGLLFIFGAWRLIGRLTEDPLTRRILLLTLLVSSGIGWLFQGAQGMSGPTDLWQPEGFTFPSLMTNALFAISLWLIVEIWIAVLDAKERWSAVPRGAVLMLVLGNIHTYDVLTFGLVAAAFAICLLARREITGAWLMRVVLIGLGAVPAVAWLWWVQKHDAVFAARAATLTFSPDPWQFVLGYLPLILLAGVALRPRLKELGAIVPLAILGLCFVRQWLNTSPEPIFMLWFLLIYALLTIGAASLAKSKEDGVAMTLLIAWAAVALWIPYFPALFQRKLTMGAHIPIALLAGLGIARIAAWQSGGREKSPPLFSGSGAASKTTTRNFGPEKGGEPVLRLSKELGGGFIRLAAVLVLLSLTNIFWLRNSFENISTNTASTKIHPVFLDPDQRDALHWLRTNASENAAVLDLTFWACYIPAFAGQKTYASHWSETPDFADKFNLVNRDIYGLGGNNLTDGERYNLVRGLSVQYVIWHKEKDLTDFSDLGDIVFDRPTLAIVKL